MTSKLEVEVHAKFQGPSLKIDRVMTILVFRFGKIVAEEEEEEEEVVGFMRTKAL